MYELEDVGVVHSQDGHVGAAAGAALFDDVGGDVEGSYEADGSGGDAAGGADDVVFGADS